MEFDIIDVTLIVFLSLLVGLLVGFAIHLYRDGNRDEEFLNGHKKVKNRKAIKIQHQRDFLFIRSRSQ
jgi:hypothetical protein